jgi:CIC family chloride channel protein
MQGNGSINHGNTISNHTRRILLALVIGVGTGLGAVGFRYLIEFFKKLFFTQGENILSPFLGNFFIILIPVAGGLIVGPLTYFFAREAKGHGVPEVMAAVAVRGGKIRPRVVIVKALASAICIGSGGSVGREGPIVQIGSAIGSTIGQLLKIPPRKLRALVACGAAGGIAATFNAPIGGVLFSLEIILGEFTGNHLIMVILSAVTAATIARIFVGDVPAFNVPAYSLNDPMELLFYALLGVLCAIFAVIYIKTLYKSEDIFDSVKFVPEYFKPAIGGLLIGIIAVSFPEGIRVFGVGYESIEMALTGKMILATTALLVVLKLLATIITLGSGGSGGVFAPGLFMGAMLGATFGFIANSMFPDVAVNPAAYALVGMGGVFAGSAQAPITAIIMLFEMSNDYGLILPLMVTCIISSVVARSIYNDNIYVVKLLRRGLDIESARRPDVLKNVLVRDVMTDTLEMIPGDFKVSDAWKSISGSPHQGFPVVTGKNKLCGIITQHELEEAMDKGLQDERIDNITSRQLVVVTVDEPLSVAVRKMDEYNIGRLPAVDPDDNSKILGLITRSDVITAYGRGWIIKENEDESPGFYSPGSR